MPKKEARLESCCVLLLSEVDSGPENSIIRLNNSNIDAKKMDRSRFFRREPLTILNPANGVKIMRYAMGSASHVGLTRNCIAIDYDGMDALGVKPKDNAPLIIRRATRLEIYQWFKNHHDLSIQLSIRLGVIGTIMGIFGVVTGLIPYITK